MRWKFYECTAWKKKKRGESFVNGRLIREFCFSEGLTFPFRKCIIDFKPYRVSLISRNLTEYILLPFYFFFPSPVRREKLFHPEVFDRSSSEETEKKKKRKRKISFHLGRSPRFRHCRKVETISNDDGTINRPLAPSPATRAYRYS